MPIQSLKVFACYCPSEDYDMLYLQFHCQRECPHMAWLPSFVSCKTGIKMVLTDSLWKSAIQNIKIAYEAERQIKVNLLLIFNIDHQIKFEIIESFKVLWKKTEWDAMTMSFSSYVLSICTSTKWLLFSDKKYWIWNCTMCFSKLLVDKYQMN